MGDVDARYAEGFCGEGGGCWGERRGEVAGDEDDFVVWAFAAGG